MQYRSKRLFSLLLVMLMVVSMFPAGALASESEALVLGGNLVLTDSVTVITDSETEEAPAPEDTETETEEAPAPEVTETEDETSEDESSETETETEEAPVAPVLETGEETPDNDGGDTETYVAKIDDDMYTTLQNAFAAVQDGDTIEILCDITFTNSTVGYNDGTYIDGVRYKGGASFTVDFNGYTVTDDGYVNDYLIYVWNTGSAANEITFTNGIITSKNGCWSAVCVNAASSTVKSVLNLNNMNITNSNGTTYAGNQAVRAREVATVNVNSGTTLTSKNASYAIAALTQNSIVNINSGATVIQTESSGSGGNHTCAAVSGLGVVNIYDGAVITSDYHGVHPMTSANPVVNIYGGTITGGDAALYATTNGASYQSTTINVYGGTINGALQTPYTNGYICVSGGTYSSDPSAYCVEGYTVAQNNDGTYGVVAYVAQVGDNKYETLAEAIAAASAGDTVTLLTDVTATECIEIGKSLTIEGNGHTVTSSASRVFRVTNSDVTVTLNAVNMNSTATRSGTDDIRGISIDGSLSSVTLNLNNCSVDFIDEYATDWCYAVNVSGDSTSGIVLNVSGGTYEGANVINVADSSAAAVTVTNAALTSLYAVNDQYCGVCISLENPANTLAATGNTFNGTHAMAYYTTKGTVTASDNTDNTKYYVAKVGTTYYYDLLEAVTAASAGDTVTMIADVTLAAIESQNYSLLIDKAITLDGSGNTLTSTAGRAINVAVDGNVTIKNLTINCSGERGINVVTYPATLTIDNVTATANNYVLNVASSADAAVVTVTSSDFTGLNVVNIAGAGAAITIRETKLTVNDQSDAENYAALMLNQYATNATITFTSGTNGSIVLYGDSVKAMSTASGGTITIDGENAIETNYVAVVQYAGTDNYYSYETLQEAINEAVTASGSTVKLLTDITENVTITDAVTIDGNGKTLSYTGSYSTYPIDITTESGEVVTINNLTITTTSERGINCNTLGTLNLDNVDITANNYALNLRILTDNGIVNITDSELTGACTLNIWGTDMQITVTDTDIISKDNSDAEDYAAVCLNSNGNVVESATGTVLTVTGGTIIAYKEDGETLSKAVRSAVEATVTISDTTEVIGTYNYPVAIVTYEGSDNFYSIDTLQAAIDKAIETNAASVKLLTDITINEMVTVNDPVVIDLNGKTVTSTAKKAFEIHADATIKNGSIVAVNRCVDTRKAVNLTLEDLSLTANMYTSYGNPQPLTIGGEDDDTTVTLSNCTIDAGQTGYGIIAFVKTTATVTGSTITGYNALYMKPGAEESVISFVNSDLTGDMSNNDVPGNSFSVIAIQTDSVTVNLDADSTVTATGNYHYAFGLGDNDNTVTGVTISSAAAVTGNVLVADSLTGNSVTLPASCETWLKENNYVCENAETDGQISVLGLAVACITTGRNTYYYTSLQAAIDDAYSGETITLLRDVTYTGNDRATIEGKTLTIDLGGHTISGEHVAVNIKAGADVTLKNGTIIDTTSEACTVQVYKAKATLASDLTVKSENGAAVTIYGPDAELTTEAALYAPNDGVIYGQGAYDGTVINIIGGTLTSDTGIVIYHPQEGTLNISGGVLTGQTGIIMKSGSLNITGGTINATGAKTDYSYKESGWISTGDAVVIENIGGNTGYAAIDSVSITGGTFTSANASAVASYTAGQDGVEAVTGFISGGTYSSNVTALCAEGYTAEQNDDGTYGIVEEEVMTGEAAIGSTVYKTLAAAITAANASETALNINILTSISEKPDVTISKAMTFVNAGNYSLWDTNTKTSIERLLDTTQFEVTDTMGIIFTVSAKAAAGDPVAKIGEVEYTSVKAALEAAQSGDTIVLTADSDEADSYLHIASGITLDLAGHKLTAAGLVAFDNTNVYDSTDTTNKANSANAGRLNIPEGTLVLAADNCEVPMWVNDGYAFTSPLTTVNTYLKFKGTPTTDGFEVEFRPSFGYLNSQSVLSTYLKTDGAADNGLTIKIRISWEGTFGTVSQTYSYSDSFVQQAYAQGSLGLVASGFSDVDKIEINPIICTDSGVEFVGETLTYTSPTE